MKIYGISGLGADERVFEYLSIEYDLIPIPWIKPKNKESIINYSRRLIKYYQLDSQKDIGILGVSFGGLIATEISKIIHPKITILISSIETKNELPIFIRMIGGMNFIRFLPKYLLNPPKLIAHFLFGTDKKELLNSILDDTDLSFTKWAVNELTTWKNETPLQNLIKVGGSNDKLLPPKGTNTILVESGEHFMIVDKATEVSNIINEQIKKYYNNG